MGGPNTFPENGKLLSSIKEEQVVKVWTNEPATCKWSKADVSYDEMENEFECDSLVEVDVNNLWLCKTSLPLEHDENTYYFRCKDQPHAEENERNANEQSYVYTLNVGKELKITSITPANGTEIKAGAIAEIDLKVETAEGYSDGKAVCRYSLTGFNRDELPFSETGGTTHIQTGIKVGRGVNTFYVVCKDPQGNEARVKTSVTVLTDEKAPIIIRVYTEAGNLVIITDEPTSCRYGEEAGFDFENGISIPEDNSKEHSVPIPELEIMYVQCRDEYENGVSRTIKPSPIS